MQGSSSTSAMLVSASQHQSLPRFQGRTLLIMRLGWLLLATVFLATFVMAIPAEYMHLSTPPLMIRTSLAQLGWPLSFYIFCQITLEIISILIYSAVGIFIFWYKSNEVIGLFVSFFLLAFSIASTPTIYALEAASPGWSILVRGINAIGWGLFAPFFYLFPDGRFVPRWTCWMALVSLAYQVFWILPTNSPLSPNQWPAWLFLPVELGLAVTCVGSPLYRYFRVSNRSQRQQTRLVVCSVLVPLSVYLVSILLGSVVPTSLGAATSLSFNILILPAILSMSSLLVPLSLGIAILRHGLWDIDILVNRTLVYGTLTISTVGLYILLVSSLGALLQAHGNFFISLLATGLVAVLFQPLRDRIQQAINRLMYGERDTPYRAISQLGQRLESTLVPDAVLPAIVETVAHSLKLPYVAIEVREGEQFHLAAAHGSPVTNPLILPLAYHSETIGHLLFAPRAQDDPLTTADRRLLDDLARQAGVATYAVRLTADLQRSRERLVTAREEERLRIRRDLHDGLGPTLASLTLKLDAVRNLIRRDPDAAETMVRTLKAQSQTALADIRRLVYALRPPALDELGLISALREQAVVHMDHGLHITIETSEPLPPLPAAVEVAIYRIVQEALTNVARHAHAHNCTVQLTLSEDLCLAIDDDGQGLPLRHHAGVGLMSMRERAAELGGTFTIKPVTTGGTQILVRLPLSKEEDNGADTHPHR